MLLDSDYDEKRLTPSDENVALISPDEGDSMTEASTEPAAPLATDHEAMKERFLPAQPEHETLDEAVFTWTIENWRQLPKRSHGPVFNCGGHPWRILFFPAGNAASESTSFYLEQGFGDDKPPEDWYACAQFMLVLHNPNDPSMYIHHEANHRFTMDEGDWGFTRFAEKNRSSLPSLMDMTDHSWRTTAPLSPPTSAC
jgi:ubiquitin carboxyl-terminal hydrolase 7